MRFHEIIGENLMSADGEEIPVTVYHGTHLSTYEEHISKHGLIPQPLPQEKQAFVFLAWSVKTAYKFAPGGDYSDSKEPGVILQITLTSEIASQIRSKLGEFLRCPVTIPVSQIKAIDYTNS